MISAVILTKNEEKNIVDCLDSLAFCDEVIVIDDNSTDRTRDLARSKGAKILKRSLNSNFAAQRNFGLIQARGEWILFVDADERVPESLAQEIKEKIASENYQGYSLNRQDYMWGRVLLYGETSHVSLVRLAKKNAGKWVSKVHETWNIKKNVGRLKHSLIHNPHPTIKDFLTEINFYSTLRAEELHMQKAKVSLFQILAYPKAKFFQNYFLRRGFLDGSEGFVMAIMMSFHSFLVRGKLYLLNHHGKIT